MPGTPFTISGVCYDRSSTAVSGVKVTLENLTNHESLSSVTSDANGAFEIEGSALASGITALDTIALVAQYGKGQHGEILAKVSAANLVTGIWDTANIYLRNGDLIRGNAGVSTPVSSINACNYGATAYTLWFLDRSEIDGLTYKVMLAMNVGANADAQNFHAGNTSLMFDGGVRVIRAATAPTNNPNSLTAGVANAIGDTIAENILVTVVVG